MRGGVPVETKFNTVLFSTLIRVFRIGLRSESHGWLPCCVSSFALQYGWLPYGVLFDFNTRFLVLNCRLQYKLVRIELGLRGTLLTCDIPCIGYRLWRTRWWQRIWLIWSSGFRPLHVSIQVTYWSSTSTGFPPHMWYTLYRLSTMENPMASLKLPYLISGTSATSTRGPSRMW